MNNKSFILYITILLHLVSNVYADGVDKLSPSAPELVTAKNQKFVVDIITEVQYEAPYINNNSKKPSETIEAFHLPKDPPFKGYKKEDRLFEPTCYQRWAEICAQDVEDIKDMKNRSDNTMEGNYQSQWPYRAPVQYRPPFIELKQGE